jgi:hypothetical protein
VRDLELPQRRPGERPVRRMGKPILGLPVVDELTPQLLQRVAAALILWTPQPPRTETDGQRS